MKKKKKLKYQETRTTWTKREGKNVIRVVKMTRQETGKSIITKRTTWQKVKK